MSDAVKTFADYLLPASVVSRIDVSRLVREVEQIDGQMTASKVRDRVGGNQSIEGVVTSEQLQDFLLQNQLSLDDSHGRSDIIKQLRLLKDNAPIIHMTFAVPADRDSLRQISAWLRESVHPQAVIAVGLQPALVAGVYLRTPNKTHDLSLRGRLEQSHEVLVREIGALRG